MWDHTEQENTESQVICGLKTPFMDPEGNKYAPPALPNMMLPGHTSSPPVPSPLSGGLMPGKAKVPRNRRLRGRAPMANPSINGADFASSKDRALLIIQGTVQLCKLVGSLCLIAAFYRSGGVGGGMGTPRAQAAGCQKGTTQSTKGEINPPGAGPTEGSAQSQAPPYIQEGW